MGGVICLELGNEKPENFDEIYEALKKICVDKKFYDIKIWDNISNCYLGDCELIYGTEQFTIRQLHVGSNNVITTRQYTFGKNGTYKREVIQ